MTEPTFQKINTDNNLQEIIQSAFNIHLNVDGGWGYNQESALIINDFSMPIAQLEHTLASMRAHLEMHMTLPTNERYSAINVNELKREEIKMDIRKYDIIHFEVSAMLEDDYNQFIQEYKSSQELQNFDLEDHFNRRKQATLKREVSFWFDVTNATSSFTID